MNDRGSKQGTKAGLEGMVGRGNESRPCLILKPLHALRAQFGLKELRAQLSSQQGNVLNNGQPHTPVLVLGQLLNGWQQALCQQVNANHLTHST